MDRRKIEKEAKEILDRFAEALSKVKSEGLENEVYIEREVFERIEGEGKEYKNFKKELLENAPEHDSDFILTEKGKWK